MGHRLHQVFSGATLSALLSSACGLPAAGLFPLAKNAVQPEEQRVAIPTEDGSHYILVEARPRTTDSGLARKWRHTADDACHGDYVVMTTGTATRRSNGLNAMRIQEGWVRCVSPEAIESPEVQRGTVPETPTTPKRRREAAPKLFAL